MRLETFVLKVIRFVCYTFREESCLSFVGDFNGLTDGMFTGFFAKVLEGTCRSWDFGKV
ncbi:MAG: hypothetical protein ACTS4U_01550 [Candidatus Hodgkinia cicadicola]